MSKLKIIKQNLKVAERVYEIVKKIPEGRVVTYGQIASRIQKSKVKSQNFKTKINPRYIGYLLHNNPDPEKVPCHRVVSVEGKIAKNYKFGGWKVQRKKLLKEGVSFRDEHHVDFKNNLR